MIDPWNVTDYDRNDADLEEFALFAIAVAGKQADVIARKLALFLAPRLVRHEGVMEYVHHLAQPHALDAELRCHGISPYGTRAAGFAALAAMCVNCGQGLLRVCDVDWLCTIPGIGPKTSRFFVLHSRRGARVAALDTHVLKFLGRELGYNVPKQTPNKPAEYAKWERVWLNHCDDCGVSPADADLWVWTRYADAYRRTRSTGRG